MPMTNASSKSCLTLNNMFAVPTRNPRNFVRENKQFVREQSKKQTTKISDVPIPTNYGGGGSQTHIAFGSAVKNMARPDPIRVQSGTNSAKTTQLTQQRTSGTTVNTRPTTNEGMREKHSPKSVKNSATHKRHPTSTRTKEKSHKNAAVQTDEIRDELYLYSALKKCASPAFKSALKSKYLQKDDETARQNNEDLGAALSGDGGDEPFPPDEGPTNLQPDIEKQHHHHQNQATQYQCKSSNGHTNPYQAPSETTTQDNYFNSKEKSSTLSESPPNNLYRKKKPQQQQLESSQNNLRPNSQQSRRLEDDIIAHYTAAADVNDLFNVMSLPPELNKKCQPSECINCPDGYHLLTEKERGNIKAKLLQRESVLIKQLNSFPLAIETLRVRQTKTRIEGELNNIEQNLRKLTKKKVYVKLAD